VRRAAIELLHKRPEVKRQAADEDKAIVVAVYSTRGTVPESTLVPHACDIGGAWAALVERAELPELLGAAVAKMQAAGARPTATLVAACDAARAIPRKGGVRVIAMGWGVTVGEVAVLRAGECST